MAASVPAPAPALGRDEWIWEALALGKRKLLAGAGTGDFDWNAESDTYGNPLIAVLIGAKLGDGLKVLDFVSDNEGGRKERLRLLQWLVEERGADPSRRAPGTCASTRRWWKNANPETKTNQLNIAGQSAYGVLLRAEMLFRAMDDALPWRAELEFVDRALEILKEYRPAEERPTVTVPERVVETWEGVLDAAAEAGDVVIRMRNSSSDCGNLSSSGLGSASAASAGGGVSVCTPPTSACCSSTTAEVWAHSAVLCNASPVLRAMLSSPFREGSRRRDRSLDVAENVQTVAGGVAAVSHPVHTIDLDDCDAVALRLLLFLIYTGGFPPTAGGSSDDEPSSSALCQALALAHRWELPHATDALARALADTLCSENFADACGLALRLRLDGLRRHCELFAKASCGIRDRLKEAGGFADSPDVACFVEDLFRGGTLTAGGGAAPGSQGRPGQKRRRLQ